MLSGLGAQHARQMTGILAAQFGGVVVNGFDQKPAAGHVTMFARREGGGWVITYLKT